MSRPDGVLFPLVYHPRPRYTRRREVVLLGRLILGPRPSGKARLGPVRPARSHFQRAVALPATIKPDRSFWQRLVSGARRLLPRSWTGESVGIDSPGYPVNPLDLFDGLKGMQPALYAMLAQWRRTCNGTPQQPQTQARAAAQVRELARLLETYNPFAQAILSPLPSSVPGKPGPPRT